MTDDARSPGRWPRETWVKLGHVATAAWMVFVLWRTGGEISHPLFDLIFLVPLIGWIAALTIARLVRVVRDRHDG